MNIQSLKFTDLIGKTPLIDLSSLVNENSARLYAKCEFMNPSTSMKDRMANHILEMAETSGQLRKGDKIVCASSGNTGCSFAMLGAARGYSVIIVTPNKSSVEKRNHIRALKAELIVTDKNESYIDYGNRLAQENGYFNINQYDNPWNPEAYYKTLGPEIWAETDGKVTHFVMTGSTFGCISGTGKFLKEKNKKIRVILADPDTSNIYNYYQKKYLRNDQKYNEYTRRPSVIEGAGKEKPTQCLDFSVIDDVIQISEQDAISTCHQFAQKEGFLIGGSSGLNIFAAIIIANQLSKENIVVTILCDSGIKYLSKIYNHDFLTKLYDK